MADINSIFPIPVYFEDLKRKFTKSELDFMKKLKSNVVNNTGNTRTKDTYVLNEAPFKKLKKDLNIMVKDYFNKVVCSKDITPYITQSWLNYTKQNQFHHRHSHANSFVSGVLYIDVDSEVDRIYFHNKHQPTIKVEVSEYNLHNSPSWWFPISSGLVVMFPSDTIHEVKSKEKDNERISLAFNVFIKGTLGNARELTELKI
jgi:uncharacterized protein (TIGR02466 family)